MSWTVHRLQPVFRIIEFHRRIHILHVIALVAGNLPEIAPHVMWGKHHIVTATDTLFAHPVFHGLADQAALRMPEDQARAGDLLNGEEVELLAENAMIARL